MLAVIAAGLSLAGPGRFAIDPVAGWDLTGWWALAGIALGLVVGAAAMATRRAPGSTSRTADPTSDVGSPAAA